jgi:hypothetical protein
MVETMKIRSLNRDMFLKNRLVSVGKTKSKIFDQQHRPSLPSNEAYVPKSIFKKTKKKSLKKVYEEPTSIDSEYFLLYRPKYPKMTDVEEMPSLKIEDMVTNKLYTRNRILQKTRNDDLFHKVMRENSEASGERELRTSTDISVSKMKKSNSVSKLETMSFGFGLGKRSPRGAKTELFQSTFDDVVKEPYEETPSRDSIKSDRFQTSTHEGSLMEDHNFYLPTNRFPKPKKYVDNPDYANYFEVSSPKKSPK